MNITIHYTFVSLPHSWLCDAVFRLVPDSIAYLGYCVCCSSVTWLHVPA